MLVRRDGGRKKGGGREGGKEGGREEREIKSLSVNGVSCQVRTTYILL